MPDTRTEHNVGAKRKKDTEPEADRQKRRAEVPELLVVCAGVRAYKRVKTKFS